MALAPCDQRRGSARRASAIFIAAGAAVPQNLWSAQGTDSEAGRILAEEFAARPREWTERLADFSGQWSPVQSSLEVLDDPQAAANGYVQEVRAGDGSPFSLVTTPVQFDEQPAPAARGPEFNEHGDDILRAELGIDDETLLDLKLRGVVG